MKNQRYTQSEPLVKRHLKRKQTMKKTPLLFLMLVWVIQATAQDKNVLQLKKELEKHPEQDTFRVNRLIEHALYLYLPAKERQQKTEEALSISRKINYPLGEGYALADMATYELDKGNTERCDSLLRLADSIANKLGDPGLTGYVSFRHGKKMTRSGSKDALNYFLKAERIFETTHHHQRLAFCREAIAYVYSSILSNYPSAMEYLLKAKESAEKAGSSYALYVISKDFANVYLMLGDYDNALASCKKAEAELKKATPDIKNSSLFNMFGEIYRLTGKYSDAINAYEQAMAGEKRPYSLCVNESNLADVYTRMNNLPLAFQYGFSSLDKAKQLGNSSIIAWIYGILSRAYLKKGMPDSAIYYGRPGLDMAKETGTIEYMRDNAAALANAFAFKKNFDSAYSYHLQYINYRDSMVSAEIRNKTAVLQHNNELEKKQAQIVQLSQQKKIQRGYLLGSVIVLALILITAGLLFRNNRQKQKVNKLLHRQKQEIDAKAQDLERSYNNVEQLGEIGRKITSSLSVETIISTVYDNVNSLMDASVFGIGIYHDDTKQIDFPATYENGVALPAYSNSIFEENRFASLCFISGKEIVMGDLETEYKKYLQHVPVPKEGEQPASLIYLPLKSKEKMFGVITVQSFQKNVYSEYHLYMLRTIAIYAAIALENAESYKKLNLTVDSLRRTQSQLIQSEKMASLGELTAGIAHEIQNPLNFVNNFSEVNAELIDEVKEQLATGDLQSANDTFNAIKQNLEKIRLHGKRADSIVKGMLQHSQSSNGVKQSIDINALTDEYLRLAYHGLRAKDKSFNAITKTNFDNRIDKISVVPQDIGRVLLNLINNAYYTVSEKKKHASSGPAQNGYEPTVTVSTTRDNGTIKIKVKDNGSGIPPKIMDKIFQPFFTTKPTGEGTGLGLSLAYDIVTKGHEGELKVETKEGEGSEFTIQLPNKVSLQ